MRKPTTEFTDEEFSLLMKTNVESVFHLSQLAYPLLKSSSEGSIVFMSSVSSFVSLKSMSVQGATKGDQLYPSHLNNVDANINFVVEIFPSNLWMILSRSYQSTHKIFSLWMGKRQHKEQRSCPMVHQNVNGGTGKSGITPFCFNPWRVDRNVCLPDVLQYLFL